MLCVALFACTLALLSELSYATAPVTAQKMDIIDHRLPPEDGSSIQSCDHGFVSASARSSASLMSHALTRSGPLRLAH